MWRKIWLSAFCFGLLTSSYSQVASFPYFQDFETSLTTGENVWFLENWWGNDVRSTNSRINTRSSPVASGNQALVVVPTSSFDGEIILLSDFQNLIHPQLTFFAASDKNGATSTRPSLVYLDWSVDSGLTYGAPLRIGNESAFPNEDFVAYERFLVDLPDSLTEHEKVLVRWTVSRGEGSGSAARWLLDAVTLQEAGPKLSSVVVANKNTLVASWDSDLDSASATALANFALSSGTIVSADWSSQAPQQVTFSTTDLPDGTQFLRVNSITSAAGNTRTEPDSFSFSYLQLALDSLVIFSDSLIWLQANQNLALPTSQVSFSDRTLNSVQYAQDSTSLWVGFSPTLNPGDQLAITFDSLQNSQGNSYYSAVENLTFRAQLRVLEGTVLDPRHLELVFNYPVDSISAYELSNFTDLSTGDNVTEANWSSSAPERIQLTWPAEFKSGDFELGINKLAAQDVAVDLLDNAVFAFSYLPLQMEELWALDPQTLQLVFNQPIPLPELDAFLLDGEMGNPSVVSLSNDTLTLVWSQEMVHNQYQLNVSGLINLNGNAPLDTSLVFFFESDIPASTFLINEIFADPNPKGLIPDSLVWPTESDREFVELFNASERTYSLAGCSLSGTELDTVSVGPGEWILLLPDTTGYGATGALLTVADWNGLTNSGEAVWLTGPGGTLVDSLRFTDSWYQDAQKEGGWSLERINPLRNCSDESNWQASVDATGATPNRANSVLDLSPDVTAPYLVSLSTYFPDSLQLTFNEPIITDTSFLAWQINPSAHFTGQWASDQRNLWLQFPDSIQANIEYTLRLDSLADCAANYLVDTTISFIWDTQAPELVEAYLVERDEVRLVWNETMAAEQDASWYFALCQSLQSATLASDQEVQLLFEEPFLAADSLWVGWDAVPDRAGNGSDKDSVLLRFQNAVDTAFSLSDRVTTVVFTQTLGVGGLNPASYYLEDRDFEPSQIVLNGEAGNAVNLIWPEALAEDRTYSLRIREVFDGQGERLFTPTTAFIWDREAPRIDSVAVASTTELLVYFDEPVDAVLAEIPANYTLVPGEAQPLFAERIGEKTVSLVWATPLVQEETYTLEVRQLPDYLGNVSSRARTYDFVWDTTAPSLLELARLSDSIVRFTFSEPIASFDTLWVEGTPSDSLVPNPYQHSVWYALSSTGKQHYQANLYDEVGNLLSLDTLWTAPAARWVRAWFTSDTTLFLQAYPPDAGTALAITDFSWASARTSQRISPAKSGAYILTFDLPIVEREGDTLRTEPFSNQSLSLTFPGVIREVEWVSPQLLALEYSADLQGFPVISASDYLVLPDSISPEAVVRTETGEQWIFSDSLQENTSYTLAVPYRWDGWESALPSVSFSLYKDTQSPDVDSMWVTGRRQLKIRFTETVELANEALSLRSRNNAVADVDELSPGVYLLEFEDRFQESDSLWLSIAYVEDSVGNVGTDLQAGTQVPNWPTPRPGDVLFTEVMADPTPSVGLPEFEYVELENVSPTDFWLEDLQIADNRDTAQLPATWWPSGSHLLLTGSSASGRYSDSIFNVSIAGFPSLNNAGETLSLLDIDGEIVATITYTDAWHTSESAEAGGVALERVSGDNSCLGAEAWATSLGLLGGTPGYANSLSEWSPDTLAPQLVATGLVSPSSLQLTFSEALDTLNYPTLTLSSPYSIQSRYFNGAGNGLTVEFSPEIDSGRVMQVSVSGAQDCIGQASRDTTVSLVVGRKPQYLELVITEVRPHPTDEVSLPRSEYLEVFNATSDVLELGGVRLEDATGSTILPPFSLAPQAYLILCPAAEVNQFVGYGTVVGLSGWRTLNKGGEPLRLYSAEGQPLHQIEYPADWFEDTWEGASWEMVDLAQPCRNGTNWGPNRSASGGSPGQINSVAANQPDVLPPVLLAGSLQDSATLVLTFNEPLAYPLGSQTRLDFQPPLSGFTQSQAWSQLNLLSLTFPEEVPRGTLYTLEVSQIADCSGNVSFETQTVSFARPEIPQQHDIVLNEVLFDAQFGGADFVEIYNRSERYLDLTDWIIGTDTSQSQGVRLSTRAEGWAIPPQGYRVLTPEPEALLAFFPETPAGSIWQVLDMPNLTNDEGSVALWLPNGDRMDALAYEESWHSALLPETKGVSLERLDFEAKTQWSENWQSAAKALGYGTPGQPNSQSLPSQEPDNSVLFAEPQVFDPRGIAAASFTSLHYTLPGPGYWGSVIIYDMQGNEVRKLISHEILAVNSWITWDGLKESGEIVPTGPYYVRGIFYHPEGDQLTKQIRIVVATDF
ncbi:MAG: lamin tail domain-containing protein [Bacteroidota bacterium]